MFKPNDVLTIWDLFLLNRASIPTLSAYRTITITSFRKLKNWNQRRFCYTLPSQSLYLHLRSNLSLSKLHSKPSGSSVLTPNSGFCLQKGLCNKAFACFMVVSDKEKKYPSILRDLFCFFWVYSWHSIFTGNILQSLELIDEWEYRPSRSVFATTLTPSKFF